MTKTTNSIATLVQTVKTTSQGATVKTTSSKPSLTAVETLNLVTASAVACASGEKAKQEGADSLKTFNDSAINLNQGGVRLLDGRKKTQLAKHTAKPF